MTEPYRGTQDAEAEIAKAKLLDEAQKRLDAMTSLERARQAYYRLGLCGVPRNETERHRLDKMHRKARELYHAELAKAALAYYSRR